MESISPGFESATSCWEMSPGSRSEWTRIPSTAAPRAPGLSSFDRSDERPPALAIPIADARRGPGRGIGLVRVVSLDHLHRLEIGGSQRGKPHHQHGSDREIGHHQARWALVTPHLPQRGQTLRSEPRRPDHHGHARRLPGFEVVEDDIGVSRLHHHLSLERRGLAFDGEPMEGRPGSIRVVQGRQLQVIRLDDGVRDRGGELAAGTRDPDPDHVAPVRSRLIQSESSGRKPCRV